MPLEMVFALTLFAPIVAFVFYVIADFIGGACIEVLKIASPRFRDRLGRGARIIAAEEQERRAVESARAEYDRRQRAEVERAAAELDRQARFDRERTRLQTDGQELLRTRSGGRCERCPSGRFEVVRGRDGSASAQVLAEALAVCNDCHAYLGGLTSWDPASSTLPRDNKNRGEYMASREWGLKKRRVRERSGGRCERCEVRPHEETHHRSYERFGFERLDDLVGVCRPCHAFLSGILDDDPAST